MNGDPFAREPPAFCLYLLGAFRLERRDDQAGDAPTGDAPMGRLYRLIRLPMRKVESLLAYLVLNPEKHAREKLAALLWGDVPDEQARHSLRTALAALRKALGDDILLADRETVQLNPSISLRVDVREFEQRADLDIGGLKARVALYQDDLLSTFYDDWILLERERLRALFEQKMQTLLEQLVTKQSWDEVIEWSERWIARGQTPEAAYQALMFAYAAQNDKVKVASTFQRVTDALHNELGVGPSEQTQTLFDQFWQGETIHALRYAPAGIPTQVIDEDEPPAPGESPYKGLQYFDAQDADWFFGREQLIAQLVGRLRALLSPANAGAGQGAGRFLAVIVGASGSGKSSVVRAGLVPALKRGDRLADGTLPPAGSQAWAAHIITPTAHPLEALALALTRDAESVKATATLMDDLVSDPRTLHLFVKRTIHPADSSLVLLVIDQFEEIFTLCKNEAERKAFVDNLLHAVSSENGQVVAVITLRADFYAHCAQYANLREAVAKHQEYIGPMSAEELRRAIEEPARRGGWELEPGLVDLILRDVGAEPGALPLLSHTLLETWLRRRGRWLTRKGYLESGGVRGAIAKTAETVYRQLSPAQRAIARRIFLRLTELGEGTEHTRRRASFRELSAHPQDEPAIQAVLKILADARLITTGENTAEVAHEALIHEWQRLREWLDEDHEGLRLHRACTQAAHEWEELGRDVGALYRGARLEQMSEWARGHPDELNALEREFLTASQELVEREEAEHEAQRQRELSAAQKLAEEQRRRAEEQTHATSQLRRRARYLVGALIVALALACVALFLGEQARTRAIAEQAARAQVEQERRVAFSRELAASAISQLDVDPERSVLLALQAVKTTYDVDKTWTAEAESALHRAVFASRTLLTLNGHTDRLWGIAYSPDGARLATGSQDKTAKIWDASTGKEQLTLRGHSEAVNRVAFSPDSKRVATTSDDHTAKVWDVATGQALLTLTGHTDAIFGIAFSPDDKRLVTVSPDKTVRVWDALTGKELLRLAESALALAVASNPDGTSFAASNLNGEITIRDTASGSVLVKISESGPVEISGLAFSPDGTRVAAVGSFGSAQIKVWDAKTGKQLQAFSGHANMVRDIAFSPDGTRLATSGLDHLAKVWDAANGQALLTLSGHTQTVERVAFSPDRTRLATASWDGAARVWDITPGKELLFIDPGPNFFGRIALSADRTRVAGGYEDGKTKVWDAATGALLVTLTGHTRRVNNSAFSPDGTRIATASTDKTARLWDASTGKELFTLVGHSDGLFGVTFSPDSTRLATTSADKTAKVWDVLTGKEILTLRGHSAAVFDAAFSPDGKRLATAGTEDYLAIVWDAVSGKSLFNLLGHQDQLRTIVFSPDGTRIATSSRDGTARIWDAATGKEQLVLRGHNGTVSGITFRADGQRVATASPDGTARIWDAATGKELLALFGDGAELNTPAFSPDGKRLYVSGGSGVRAYILQIDELMALARTRVTRTWTPNECQRFLHSDGCPPP